MSNQGSHRNNDILPMSSNHITLDKDIDEATKNWNLIRPNIFLSDYKLQEKQYSSIKTPEKRSHSACCTVSDVYS
jgi:hypothetical protein